MPYKSLFTFKLCDNISMSASFASVPIDCSTLQGFSIQGYWTGVPTGTLELQMSNDGINWDTYIDSSLDVATTSKVFWNVSEIHFDLVKVVFTHASGTGSFTAWANGKGDDNA